MRNRNQKTFQLSLISAAVTATLAADFALAQQPLLEEVIVTATRRAASVQDIPLNITALGSDLIERERLTNFAELARRVPGMIVVDQGPRSSNTLTIRGLTTDSIAAPDQTNNTGGTVATYIGEIPFYVDLRLNDMERIEVLRGPQGTLYGAGTLGGAVRYIPNKPQSDGIGVELRGDVFSLSQSDSLGYDGGGTINIPIIEDRLAVRASIDYLDDPGFIDYNFLVREPGVSNPQPNFNDPADVQANLRRKEDANTNETLSGRLAVRYTGERVDGTLTYHFQDSEIGARQINHKEAFGTGDYESAMRFLEPNDRENELLSLEIIADLGFAELTSATGYGEYTENGQRDQTDLLYTLGYGYEYFPSFAAFTREDSEEQTFTQELRLVSTSDGPWNWIVGAFYSDFEQDSQSREFTPGYDQFLVDIGDGLQLRPDDLEYIEVFKDEFKEYAAFGELGYRITDAWQVTVGARWYKFENESSGGFDTPLYNTVLLGAPQDAIDPALGFNDVDDDDVIYKFNTSYDVNDDMMVFATVSEGYRLGGLNAVPECPDPLPPGQNVCVLPSELLIKSDTTTNYELGLRSTWLDNSLVLNGSLFLVEWDDVRVADVTTFGQAAISTNGGSAESMGLELEAQYRITDNLSLMGSYAYTKAELTDDALCLLGGDPADPQGCLDSPDDVTAFDGDRLPATPEHQGFLALNYVFELSGGSRVDLDWSATYSSDILTKVGERNFGESLDGYAVHNASATWFNEGLAISLYADNLLDEYAETGVRGDRADIGQFADFDSRRFFTNVLRPRQVGVRLVYNFDG